jgi:SpoVK/Ycf46/Vps4 family AAA+-type ATPase
MLGEDAPRGVVFIDEINDALAGAGTDTSGVKGDIVGTLLQYMQNKNADGILLIGPPGTGKTLIGEATASVTNRVMINFDIAATQQGIVGSSGENVRTCLSVVDATTQGRALFIATCNSMSNLPPQLKRRFRDGIFFVDIPDAAGREALWALFEKRFNVSGPRPDDEGWTGAEIENCCRKAYRLKMTLKESARFIIPISTSGAEQLESLRRQASGKFLSAGKPGVYTYSEAKMPANVVVKRKFQEA